MPLTSRFPREPTPFHRPYHLLEELAAPAASVNTGRITVWVYREPLGMIREIVLSGHAESSTCKAATTAITEALKQTSPKVWWFLTCGAAHIKVASAPPVDVFARMFGAGGRTVDADQQLLGQMVAELGKLEAQRGLVTVNECELKQLEAFRQQWQSAAKNGRSLLVLPDASSTGRCADYVPVCPAGAPDKPLIFHFNGWDFDDPMYQSVADMHLHHLMRETLSDAMRRRRTYRGWLHDWLFGNPGRQPGWVDMLHALPRAEAFALKLKVPSYVTDADGKHREVAQSMNVSEFLTSHVHRYLASGEQIGHWADERFKEGTFEQVPREDLHKKKMPKGKIMVFDFQRCRHDPREAVETDARSLHDTITSSQPDLISEALRHIAQMNLHIEPYERLRNEGLEGVRARDMRFHDGVSRIIVLETMLRGWPSYYLNHEQDRRKFDAWAAQRRDELWRMMVKQTQAAGVAPEILLEDNVVFDVRLDDNLGCTVQPLMLVDDAAHAQLHGTRAGASVAIPLWPRRDHAVVDAAAAPAKRAETLVRKASESCWPASRNTRLAVESLREALDTHPARAGRLIIDEWLSRLGSDAFATFEHAQLMLEAVQLNSCYRFDEAFGKVTKLLMQDPRPLPDAIALAGLTEASRHHSGLRKFRESRRKHELRVERLRAVHEELRPLLEVLRKASAAQQTGLPAEEGMMARLHQFERLNAERQELERKMQEFEDQTIKPARVEAEERAELIRKALKEPFAVRDQFPALARAATQARDLLENSLKLDDDADERTKLRIGTFGPQVCTSAFIEQCHQPYDQLVTVMGLLDAVQRVHGVSASIGRLGPAAREQHVRNMTGLAGHLWLPGTLGEEVKAVAEEFEKGDWDQLQTRQIESFLEDASRRCQEEMSSHLDAILRGGDGSLIASLARIHLCHVGLHNYLEVFRLLSTVVVTVKDLIGRDVEVLSPDFTAPPGSHLEWQDMDMQLSCVTSSGTVAVLRFSKLKRKPADRLRASLDGLATDGLPSASAPLAERILAAPLEPPGEWMLWLEVMQMLKPEIVAVLSDFMLDTCVLPTPAWTLSKEEQAEQDARFVGGPRGRPIVDVLWRNLDRWGGLVPSDIQRAHLRAT